MCSSARRATKGTGDDSEIFMGCRELCRARRRGHIAYGRVELHDVGDDITRALPPDFLFSSAHLSSSSHERGEAENPGGSGAYALVPRRDAWRHANSWPRMTYCG
ncbi:hypothetical protein KM043_009896 [Ampulex compressa]|nr:hypothetical protein KM043_009896 [Ampulex compressa]